LFVDPTYFLRRVVLRLGAALRFVVLRFAGLRLAVDLRFVVFFLAAAFLRFGAAFFLVAFFFAGLRLAVDLRFVVFFLAAAFLRFGAALRVDFFAAGLRFFAVVFLRVLRAGIFVHPLSWEDDEDHNA